MNTNLKVSFLRSYRSKNGTVTFVYKVTGSADAMERYAEVQGDFLRTDEATGDTLWFTTRFMGETGSIIVTANDKIVADMSKYEQAASLCSQFSGVFGEKLAEASIKNLLGKKGSTPAPEEPNNESV